MASRFPPVALLLLLTVVPIAAQNAGRTFTPTYRADLAGCSLADYPFFTHVRAFNEGDTVEIAIDTIREPRLANKTIDVYVIAHRNPVEWMQDRFLVDVRGAPQTLFFPLGGTKDNIYPIDPGTLNGQTGTTEVGVGYDVVLDYDRDGVLGPADVIDGWNEEAGFYVMPDLTQPGPYEVTEVLYNGGGFLRQDIYYPTNVELLNQLPLIVVSHGNGHNYQWYDHIGYHMASWGYVVMSHRNNTGPGIETASTTTLRNTQHFLRRRDIIAGGVLLGKIDERKITWIGHSRGGEGVVRAYQRLLTGEWTTDRFSTEDIRLVSSIAPTDFLGPVESNPAGVPYHLWTGGSDSDVNGCANCNICQTFHLHDRADGERFSISLHGVGHGDFHDGGGNPFATGPCLVGTDATHQIMRGYLLALVKHVVDGNIPCKDYLWRQWESFRPIGAPDNECVVVDLMYREHPRKGKLVLDDFQTNPDTNVSSSGGAVLYSVVALSEGLLDDNNNSFSSTTADPMNGMTLVGPGDDTRGIVFEWDGADEHILFEVPGGPRDLTTYEYLSFRAAQSTRHPLTTVELGDLTFSVQLVDADGTASTINLGIYGGGIEEPYQRRFCGTGRGWANEFETIRIPVRDFRSNASPLALEEIVGVSFLFGPSNGSPEGRIGLDEIEFTVD